MANSSIDETSVATYNLGNRFLECIPLIVVHSQLGWLVNHSD
jgi:hypothetical protein